MRRLLYVILITLGSLFIIAENLFCQMEQAGMEEGETGRGEMKQDEMGKQGKKVSEAKPEGEEKGKKEKPVSLPMPVIEIKRLEGEQPLFSIELRDAEVSDLFRILAHDYDLNILVDKKVKGKITASLTNVSLEEALQAIIETSNLNLKKQGKILKLTPNLITKTFVLKYVEAKNILESTGGTTGETSTGGGAAAGETSTGGGAAGGETSTGGGAAGGEAAGGGGTQGTATKTQSTIYDLVSEDGKVLLGKQPNSIMVIDYPENLGKIEQFLNMVDQRMISKVFKLKYLSAQEIVGQTTTATSGTSATTSTSSTGTTSGSSSGGM